MPRIEHKHKGDESKPCEKCGFAFLSHRTARVRVRTEYHRKYDNIRRPKQYGPKLPPKRAPRAKGAPRTRRVKEPPVFIGCDGEGHEINGVHTYTYFAAVDERMNVIVEVENPKGLSTSQAANAILAIPRNSKCFGYAFGYDLTMMIKDLPDEKKYRLLRPQARTLIGCLDCRQSWPLVTLIRTCPKCGSKRVKQKKPNYVRWNEFGFDYFNGSLTVCRGWDKETKKWAEVARVSDCFRFFGTSFVSSLEKWNTGSTEERALIQSMKDKRGTFENEDKTNVKKYCRLECGLLAQMMRKLDNAHIEAGIPLRQYFGAGSTASALLTKFKVKEYKGEDITDMQTGLQTAILSSFFGGRFENSTIGLIEKSVNNYDISSAYPYAQTFLPCLKCGIWSRARKSRLEQDIQRATIAVCKFHVKELPFKERKNLAWAPLPFRDPKTHSICFPVNFTGWAWREEVQTAIKGWPELIEIQEAWCYTTQCDHKPFSYIPEIYRKRIEWGKEGPGIVLKLGVNAGYGKTAQSLGDNPPFQSWVWAALTTSYTRTQLLELILQSVNRWDVLAVATDGAVVKSALDAPKPERTGTEDLEKPLGGWEHKVVPEGVFLAKPGVYFRAGAKEEEIRARGIGRKEMFEQYQKIIKGFHKWDKKDYKFTVRLKSKRFYGVKHCVQMRSGCNNCQITWPGIPEHLCPNCGRMGDWSEVIRIEDEEGRDAYGQWRERRIDFSFEPFPKRERIYMRGSNGRLLIKDVGGAISSPYSKGLPTPEGMLAKETKEFLLEQPDWDEI